MSPREAIEAGCTILDPLLVPAGFDYQQGESGSSSGGSFATGAYANGDRRIEFSFRWGLGCVIYKIGEFSINHNELMEKTGHGRDSKYLWYNKDDPMNGFTALAYDLEYHVRHFVNGNTTDFIRFADRSEPQ